MTKKLFRNAILFFTFILGGIFLNSCSDLNLEKNDGYMASKIADVSFSISTLEAKTVLPNKNEHDLTKYLYLYKYTLSYIDENSGEVKEEKIICDDLDFDEFLKESTIRLATGREYTFSLKAKDGAVTRMEGSTTLKLNEKPSQTVTIVLVPAGDEYGQKLRVDWYVPDDGVITRMKAGISSEPGHAEFQTEEEILDPDKKYRFQEYVFSVIDNPFAAEDPHKAEYGETVKKIELTYDNVKTNVPRWLDYKFYDENGILVYESSESVYMVGGKTSSAAIFITTDHYYRRNVIIPVKKDGSPWENNPDLKLKLVDEKGNQYIFKPGEDGKTFTGNFNGILPGASSGLDSSKSTDGIFDIFITLKEDENSENNGFIKTGAKYDANTGTITGNGGQGSAAVDLVTVQVPQKGVTLTPIAGVVSTDGIVGDGSGKGGLIVPAGQNFDVKVNLDIGYAAENGSTITVGGKTVANGGTVTLNSKDLAGEITYTGIKVIEYNIVYKSNGSIIEWQIDYSPVRKFNIESENDIDLPLEENFKTQDGSNRIAGWWFGTGTVENNLDNIIHKINKEKTVKEKLILAADNTNTVVLNVYWIPQVYIEYRIEYKFEELGSDPVNYIEDETVLDVNKKKVVPFHNVVVQNGVATDIDIPEVPGFTSFEIESAAAGVTSTPAGKINVPGTADATIEIHYKRNDVKITLDGNGGNWTDGKSTHKEILSGKYGGTHAHVDDPIRDGYQFIGWYRQDDLTKTIIKHVDDHKFPTDSVYYLADWKKTHANYTVRFYYEKADLTGYEEAVDEAKIDQKGTIGAFPSFDTAPKEGFTYNIQKRSITAGEGGPEVNVVQEDDSTLVKLYFDRKLVTFTLKATGGKFTDGNGNETEEIILEGKYGTDLPSVDSRGFTVATPQPPVLDEHAINDGTALPYDYSFLEWHVGTGVPAKSVLPAEFPAENAIYTARWKAENGLYKINHYAESMDKDANGNYKYLIPEAVDGFIGQMLEGSVTKKGKIGSTMDYYQTEVTGFELPTVEIRNSSGTLTGVVAAENIPAAAKIITADEKTEVIIKYSRKVYTINFHLNDSAQKKAKWYGVDPSIENLPTLPKTGKYRTDFTPPANPVREHFIFAGWTTDTSTNKIVDVVPSFKNDAPTDYYAVWYSKTSGGLQTDTSDIALAYSVNGNEIAANVGGNILATGDWTYSWSVNNVPVLAGADGVTFEENGKVLKLSGCLTKDYEITVVAKHDGKVYTKTAIVTVR